MIYLVDANVLLRYMDAADAQHAACQNAVKNLRSENHILRASYQNYVELWNVFTRPVKRNGMGRTPVQANTLLQTIEQLFPPLSDSPSIYQQWRRLVVSYNVSGVQVHDTRLVATMLAHRVTHILTFNFSDFTRYSPEGIVAVTPGEI